jgi:hypothetical protein
MMYYSSDHIVACKVGWGSNLHPPMRVSVMEHVPSWPETSVHCLDHDSVSNQTNPVNSRFRKRILGRRFCSDGGKSWW